uniref:Uncharacterized protein n=1 Tax=Clastoptera arizonana TaxID=38151 RepID=A0A1B6E4P6_9HEMI
MSKVDEEEFNNFLLKVNEIGSIIKGLTSNDKRKSNEALQIADRYLDTSSNNENYSVDETSLKIKKNRTVINQKAFDSLNEPKDSSQMSQECFMSSVEQDIKQRAEDRRLRKQVADGFKTRAIKAFRNKEYEKALILYNKAIDEIRDSCLLYTSRALTCLHLGLYERVITDCDLALGLNENSLKGWLYKAKANLFLEQEEESRRCVQEALTRHSDTSGFILDYMAKPGI